MVVSLCCFVVLLLLVSPSVAQQKQQIQIQQQTQQQLQQTFDINEAYNQLMYSYSAYCAEATVTSWNCYYCTLNSSMTTKGFKPTAIIKNALTNTFGYVGVQGTIVEVVFRGTQSNSLQNWITDISAGKSAPYPNVTGATVHSGFLTAYDVVRTQVRNAVEAQLKAIKATRVIFTGHSLGAALATLALVDIAPTISVPSFLYNYGSPRVGNLQFMTYYQSLVSTSYRIVNRADIVPHVPTVSMGFHHVAQEVWWNTVTHYKICDNSGEDKTCSDSVLIPNIQDHLDYLGINLNNC
jgi:type II secretory pathway pseudopilin PulG